MIASTVCEANRFGSLVGESSTGGVSVGAGIVGVTVAGTVLGVLVGWSLINAADVPTTAGVGVVLSLPPRTAITISATATMLTSAAPITTGGLTRRLGASSG